MREPDAAFADPRQAVLYDVLDDDRSDLDAYVVVIADEVAARSVVDLGCGTGSLAVRLSALGLSVVGVDSATASLEVARAKPHAEKVTWVSGDATALKGLHLAANLAVMAGNVAQVSVSDDDWQLTLAAVSACLRSRGWFAFETRRPEVRAWEAWEVEPTTVALPDGTTAVFSRTVTEVALPLVTFESATIIGVDVLRSVSTLRFRERGEVERDLEDHGFEVVDVRDAQDRPGAELVFIARRTAAR